MAKDMKVSILIDFYGQLLTEKQLHALELYYNEDLSLSEIAEGVQISRQGVRDTIKRGEKLLTDYETKLGLVQKFMNIRDSIGEMNKIIEKLKLSYDIPELESLRAVSEQLIGII